MANPKIMILGAGDCQVPIIKQAQKMGFYVIAVSVSGDYPGFAVADSSYEIDVCDKEKILDVADKENIQGILTDQTDMSVPSVAHVAEHLGLPGIGYDCAMRFTNKFLMRQCCEEIGVPVPKYFQASSLKDAEYKTEKLGFPVIVKPVDSQGSRGVSIVEKPESLLETFSTAKSYSRDGSVIIEKCCRGREIVVEGFASNFKFLNLIMGDSYDMPFPSLFIPKQRIFPTSLKDSLKHKILNLNKQLIVGMGLKFGITHSEYLVDEDTEEVYLIEVAARGGGVYISSDLIPLTCGIDVNELLIKIATNRTISHDLNIRQENASGYICFSLPEGRILSVSGIDEITDLEGVHKVFLNNVTIGKQVKKISDKTMRFGPILVKGKNREALQESIQKIKKTLVIEVETKDGLKGIVW